MRDGNAGRAIVVGASSGIGRALAKQLASRGYSVGLVARRLPLLQALQREIGRGAVVEQIDVSEASKVDELITELIQEMGGMDLMVISAGTGYINPNLEWPKESETIAVNVTGFAAVANVAMQHFLRQGSGHLVAISSIAALRGSPVAPAYNASKAFESAYLDGLRQKVNRLRVPITVTDIQPGFVDTEMAKGESLFWVATPEAAARQIDQAIRLNKKHAYVTRRWRLVAWLFKLAPDWLLARLG